MVVFQVLKVLLIKECKIYTASLPVPLFLVALQHIRIYISRYHFYNFIQHLVRKDFCHKLSFFIGFTKPPTPLTAKIW